MLTNEEYHAHPAISASNIKAFRHSPLHLWHTKFNTGYIQPPPTPSMALGTAVHCAVLEPARFQVEYGAGLDLPRRTNADKAAHAAHEEQYKYVLPHADYQAVLGMAAALLEHPTTGPLLEEATERESSHFTTCPLTGLELKCRPDGLLRRLGMILDIKTTADASDDKVKWTVRNFGYDIQAAHYTYVLDMQRVMLLMVENTPPYAVRAVRFRSSTIQQATVAHRQALHDIAALITEHGTDTPWPAYPSIHSL
jgi:hypothetical protein